RRRVHPAACKPSLPAPQAGLLASSSWNHLPKWLIGYAEILDWSSRACGCQQMLLFTFRTRLIRVLPDVPFLRPGCDSSRLADLSKEWVQRGRIGIGSPFWLHLET